MNRIFSIVNCSLKVNKTMAVMLFSQSAHNKLLEFVVKNKIIFKGSWSAFIKCLIFFQIPKNENHFNVIFPLLPNIEILKV